MRPGEKKNTLEKLYQGQEEETDISVLFFSYPFERGGRAGGCVSPT